MSLLARCRGVPIRDANKRWRIVPMHNSSLIARNRFERVISVVLVLAVSGIGIAAGWHTAPLWCVPIMAILFTWSTFERLKPIGVEHRRLSVRDDRCPWCGSSLADLAQGEKRACQSCPGQWWDVAGLEAGTSPQQDVRRRAVYNTFAAIVGIALGFLMYLVASSVGLVELVIIGGLVLAFAAAAAYAYARRFANPLVFAAALALPPVVAAVAGLINGEFARFPTMIAVGAGSGILVLLAGQRGARQRPRDILHGRGRECAKCGYDLKIIAVGKPCPECGSLERVR